MLSVFRSKGLTSAVYGVIIVAMILVFVIQFNPSAGKKTATLGEQCAARVRGWCINPKDHLAAFRILIPRGPQGELQTKKAKQMGLMKVALDGLVERELLVSEAERIGLSVNEDEVTDEIFNGFIHVSLPSDNPGLAMQLNVLDGKVYAGFRDQKSKRFDLKVYERSIKALVGRSPSEFREEQARELLAAKVRDVVRTPVRVSDVEAMESYIDEKSTASVSYVQVRQTWAAKYAVPGSAADIEAWSREPGNQGVIDAALRDRSGNHVRHILAKFPSASPSAEDKAQARAKIDRAMARLKAGEPFRKVAAEMSDDGSAAKGGDLGEKTDGFVEPFRVAADKLKPGEMTQEPVETEFGYHIISKDLAMSEAALAEIRKATAKELYAKTKAPDVARSLADKIAAGLRSGTPADDVVKGVLAPITAAYAATHPAPAARPTRDAGAPDATVGAEAGAPPPPATDTPDTDPTRPEVVTTSAFNKGGDPIPTLPAESATRLLKFAFVQPKDGAVIAEPLRSDDGFVVALLKEHKTATKEEFDKDRETYALTLMARKQVEALSLYVKRLREQAKGEIKLDDKYLADKMGTSKDGGAAPAPTDEDDEGM